MVSRKEALELILGSTGRLQTTMLPLEKTLEYVAGDYIYATADIPRFDRAAMDGYAICSKDTSGATAESPVRLKVVGEIHPSTPKLFPIESGQAARIMTGGPIPPEADAVVKEEDVEFTHGTIDVRVAVQPCQYISKKGKDMKMDSLVLKPGDLITPAALGTLACLQIKEVPVIRKPDVCVIAVGNELIDICDTPREHKIVASNIYMLSGMIDKHGGRVRLAKIAKDDKDAIRKDVEEGLKGDILITTGGSSNAHSDLTRALMAEIGIDMKFAGVCMRPGKGTSFGLYGKKPVFCLPGTPSAVYVTFYSLVLPALLRLRGARLDATLPVKANLEQGIKRKPGTEHLVQGLVTEEGSLYRVLPLVGPEAETFSAMSRANGLVMLPPDKSHVSKGQTVSVQFLDNPQTSLLGRQTAQQDATRKREAFVAPVVSIVGKSHAGKTTLLERLIPELKGRGYWIGTIKHDVHGFDIDHEGKDSWRHRQAGAQTVTISSPKKVAVIKDMETEETLDGLVSKYFPDADIIFTEGYKKEHKPKIEVFRSQIHDQPLCRDDDSLVALVSDIALDLGVPRLKLDDIKGLADLVEQRFLLKTWHQRARRGCAKLS